MGTICCVAGATVITLYKGPTIYSPSTTTVTLQGMAETTAAMTLQGPGMFPSLGDAKGKSWTLGCVYLIGHCLSWSAWLVLQAPVLKKYPARLSVTSFTCFFGLIQFLIIAVAFERDAQAWLFHSGAEAFSIVYAVSWNAFFLTFIFGPLNLMIINLDPYGFHINFLTKFTRQISKTYFWKTTFVYLLVFIFN